MTRRENKTKTAFHFAVNVTDLKNGPLTLCRDIPLDVFSTRLGNCEYEAEPISGRVQLELEPCAEGILVRGNIDATIRTQCGMCLADTVLHLNPSVSAFFLPRLINRDDWEGEELTPEDLEKEWFDGETIALDELIYDTVILELPMNPKCGGSCPGFQKLTTEPKMTLDQRLAPLMEFKVKKES